ncbi:MAG: hypothetical protein AB8B74_14940 [Crocinitomicaceae bacterium]
MKKLVLILGIVFTALVSCNKDIKTVDNNFDKEISNESETFTVRESGFSITEVEPLSGMKDNQYTSGILEYVKSNNVLATFNYSDIVEEFGEVTIEGKKKKCGLGHKKDWDGKDKSKWKKGNTDYFKKIVVEPIVKADDCNYIVSGVIKYYDMKTGAYTATVDFGDGTCDDIASKTTADGSVYQFTISQYYK